MKIAILTTAAVLAFAGAAVAQTAPLTDMQFVAANRCLGLASSTKLDGGGDTAAVAAKLKLAARGRAMPVLDKASEARASAKREADRARETSKPVLTAERDGAECRALTS